MRAFPALTLLTLLAVPAFTQSPTPVPAATAAFDIADVHNVSPNHFGLNFGAALRGDRYITRQNTMADLVAEAYGLDSARVFGGPPWLERDRYDIIAKAPAGTLPATLKLMLQSLLADRFHLVVHNDTKPAPAYQLSLDGPKPKLKPAEASEDSTCENKTPPREPGSSGIQKIHLVCRNVTMAVLADTLQGWGGDYFPQPVIDDTGLKDAAFDFELSWNFKTQLRSAGADGISLPDAVEKQLGLKLELKTAPGPVLVVDSVDEKPTPNRPDLDKVFPPPPPAEFEVATIKPSKAGSDEMNAQIGGNQINVTNMNLKFIIDVAWDLSPNDNENIVNAPKWLDSSRYDILAKAASMPTAPGRNAPPMDSDDLRAMIRQLIVERFNLKSHTEQRPVTGYTLLAVSPKLKKADPTTRTACKEGPGPDGKDPRIANPMLSRLLYCTNMNMAQFAEELQQVANGYIYGDVLDSTGLEGAYDFTLSFSSFGILKSGTDPGASGISDPTGAISLFDAVSKQLGLKLEKGKRQMDVLVIDHIDEKPTEN